MSDQSIPSDNVINNDAPAPEAVAPVFVIPTTEEKIKMMEDWRKTVESHIAEYADEKEKEMVVYRRQKEMYDKWLQGRLKKIKKFDTLISGRKKVILDIDREIRKLKGELDLDDTQSSPSTQQ